MQLFFFFCDAADEVRWAVQFSFRCTDSDWLASTSRLHPTWLNLTILNWTSVIAVVVVSIFWDRTLLLFLLLLFFFLLLFTSLMFAASSAIAERFFNEKFLFVSSSLHRSLCYVSSHRRLFLLHHHTHIMRLILTIINLVSIFIIIRIFIINQQWQQQQHTCKGPCRRRNLCVPDTTTFVAKSAAFLLLSRCRADQNLGPWDDDICSTGLVTQRSTQTLQYYSSLLLQY